MEWAAENRTSENRGSAFCGNAKNNSVEKRTSVMTTANRIEEITNLYNLYSVSGLGKFRTKTASVASELYQ